MVRIATLACACLLGQSLFAAGCTTLIPGMTPRDVQRDAAEQERRRCDAASPVDAERYGPGIVERVGPHYVHTMGGPNGSESHLAGAELELRPLPGVTAELLERNLMCRSAQLLLQHAAPLPSEPYFLPDAWVKITVSSGGGSFAVTLVGDDDAHGREIYARALAFVAKR